MTEKPIKAPEHLKGSAKKLWHELQDEYDITDSGGLALLQTACECWGEMETARLIIEREGLTVVSDTTGYQRLHPAARALKEARAAFYRAIGMLNLDITGTETEKGSWR